MSGWEWKGPHGGRKAGEYTLHADRTRGTWLITRADGAAVSGKVSRGWAVYADGVGEAADDALERILRGELAFPANAPKCEVLASGLIVPFDGKHYPSRDPDAVTWAAILLRVPADQVTPEAVCRALERQANELEQTRARALRAEHMLETAQTDLKRARRTLSAIKRHVEGQ